MVKASGAIPLSMRFLSAQAKRDAACSGFLRTRRGLTPMPVSFFVMPQRAPE
jgi:hypothetical protein